MERTRALLLLVDPTFEPCGRALTVLRRELADHGNRLAELPFAVAVTKKDLQTPEEAAAALEEARAWGQEHGALEVIQISSVTSQGLDTLRHLLRKLYQS